MHTQSLTTKRYAFHALSVDGHRLGISPVVVELQNDVVIRYYQLSSEEAMTEWIGGEAEIIKGNLIF